MPGHAMPVCPYLMDQAPATLLSVSPQGQQHCAAGSDHAKSPAWELCIVKPTRDLDTCKLPPVGKIKNQNIPKCLTPSGERGGTLRCAHNLVPTRPKNKTYNKTTGNNLSNQLTDTPPGTTLVTDPAKGNNNNDLLTTTVHGMR